MESFPSYGSRIFFFSLVLRPYYFFSTPLEPFYFFSCISRTKIFFEIKKPSPPPPPPITKWSVPYAICNNKGADQPRQYDISSIYIGNFMTLASFFSRADRLESYLVENPEDRFSLDEAHMGKLLFNLPSYNLKSGGLPLLFVA